jgi:hypothetical protein
MKDTEAGVQRMVDERYRRMSPVQRMRVAASMFETARALVEASLSPNLSRRERRLALVRRLYAGELPEKALAAFADWLPR